MARQQPFERLAIVNRGEAAMRLIHAVRELNETREEPIRLIAFYTEPERRAMFVRQSDEAYVIDSYLDYASLERALVGSRADAAWVGWGFVAEHPDFAELCERLDIVFVGPDSQVMRVLGDKVEAKRLAEESRVPVARWSDGPVETIKEALAAAKHIGFPLMVKAAAGGGGRGIRRVDALGDLHAAFESASSEARKAFGSGSMLLERVLSPARHVEVQVIADGCGSAWAVGVRDCSLQRRNQKVVEESSSPALSEDQERLLKDAAVRLILRAGYRNAATVEFLYEPARKHFSFMEVNARLQVEHPVTEAVTGLDLVKLQLHVAAGGRLEGEPPASVGHAVEARLCAEDPALGFAPAPGRIALLRLPSGPGIRVDTGVAQGDVVPAEFDSMIAKIIAWGRDRAEALARLRRALADTTVVIEGGATNQSFLLELLGREEVRTGRSRPRCSTARGPPPGQARRATATSRCCRPPSTSPTQRRQPTGRASTSSPAAGGRSRAPPPRARSSCATAAMAIASPPARSAHLATGWWWTGRRSRRGSSGSRATSAVSRWPARCTGR